MKLKIFYCPTTDTYYEFSNNTYKVLRHNIVLWASQYYDSLVIKRQPKKQQERFKKWLKNNSTVTTLSETIRKT